MTVIAPETSLHLRDPAVVMRLRRLGSLHASRLSFMRILTRRMACEHWRFERPAFAVNDTGTGHAVYTAHGPARSYSLVAFAHDLPDHLRSDRVIAEAWDATFALFDGVPTDEDIERLRQNVPHQEAGRVSERELTLSRANRSVRLWDHVVERLAQGRQPDADQLVRVGYLMRTTAVYGSGKFGAADRAQIAQRPEMSAPFQAEMLTVYLIRIFVRDLVEHHARLRGGDQAVPLADDLAAGLGIGNSTGLGMAPFLVNHPVLFNNWILARETAIARIRALPQASETEWRQFTTLFEQCQARLAHWQSDHPLQIAKLDGLRQDAGRIQARLTSETVLDGQPWNRLMIWAETALTEEGQEWLASLILEPYGALVDDLTDQMADDVADTVRLDGRMSVGTVKHLIRQSFAWALELNWQNTKACARAWYVSAEKLEPRLGERHDEPIADYEQPLAPARDATAAYEALAMWEDTTPVARFLMAHPDHRLAILRAQLVANAPYGEIRDNTIDADMLPIDMLRAKLSFFGAGQFDPRSDRWVRICMYAGAPYPQNLSTDNADFWVYAQASS